MEIIKYFFFIILYLYISNWFQINTFVRGLLKPKNSVTFIQDKWVLDLIKRKVGLNLSRIIIFETKRIFGMMPGIPLKPEMILSRGLYESFNKDELEWVILHESAHCVLWHTFKSAVVEILFLSLGLWILSLATNNYLLLIITPFLVITLSLISIQVMRYFEYQADDYSIAKVDNPLGVITATEKLVAQNGGYFYSKGGIARKLLFWNILPYQRIQMAQKRLQ